MLTSLVGVFFGCRHRRTTFPLTRPAGPRPAFRRTHVTCLDCGKEFPYDWTAMQEEKGTSQKAKVKSQK